jgi:hypothetical protein
MKVLAFCSVLFLAGAELAAGFSSSFSPFALKRANSIGCAFSKGHSAITARALTKIPLRMVIYCAICIILSDIGYLNKIFSRLKARLGPMMERKSFKSAKKSFGHWLNRPAGLSKFVILLPFAESGWQVRLF